MDGADGSMRRSSTLHVGVTRLGRSGITLTADLAGAAGRHRDTPTLVCVVRQSAHMLRAVNRGTSSGPPAG
jgi:hypothetical protein